VRLTFTLTLALGWLIFGPAGDLKLFDALQNNLVTDLV
jgi:hypothetical protein